MPVERHPAGGRSFVMQIYFQLLSVQYERFPLKVTVCNELFTWNTAGSEPERWYQMRFSGVHHWSHMMIYLPQKFDEHY